VYRYLIPLLLMPELAHARTVIGIAERFLAEATRIGIVVGLIGLVYGAGSMAAGKQGSGATITNSLIGLIIMMAIKAVQSLLQSMV